jgi:purine-cytosine permease-like protein
VLKGDIPISRTARFSSLLIDAVAGYYFFYWVKNTVIMIFGGGNFMHFLMDVFHWPMYFVFAYLYFYVARKVYGQSVGEAVINNSVLDFNVAKLQSGEQSGPDDVLDDGFIKRF